MRIRQLNHVGLDVHDVERSAAFYARVLRLERIGRPDFGFPGAWFQLCEDKELHIIGFCRDPVYSHDRGNHFALEVDDLDEWEDHIRTENVGKTIRRFRPDGAEQLYFKDPDGHVVELYTPPPPRQG